MTAARPALIPAVRLIDEAGPEPARGDGDVEEQAFWRRGVTKVTEEFDLDAAQLQRSLDDITEKLAAVLANQPARPAGGGFALESFSVGLSVSASGKLFLVADLGVEASVQLTFARLKADRVPPAASG